MVIRRNGMVGIEAGAANRRFAGKTSAVQPHPMKRKTEESVAGADGWFFRNEGLGGEMGAG